PKVRISRLDVTLPGKKDLKVTPAANVTNRANGAATVATVYVPLTEAVTLEWSEAAPAEGKTEAAANAEVYHDLYAQEGVLYAHAKVRHQVTRGATSQIRIVVPPAVQVNRIESPDGAVVDWRLALDPVLRARVTTVFLNRELTGELVLDVQYDRPLGAPGEDLEL